MSRSNRCFMIMLSAILLLALVACGTPSQAQGASASSQLASSTPTSSLKSINWSNFTYFSNCYGNTQPFRTQNGQAVNNAIHFFVYTPKYGDLTGDAQPEAVVPYQCSAADSMGVHVFIYSGTAAHPRLLGDLPPASSQGTRSIIANVTAITISNEVLHLEGDGYSSSAPHCCPDLFIKMDYKWNGRMFVNLESNVSKR